MTMERLTITLPEDLVTQARTDVAAGRARSVSAWISDRLSGMPTPSVMAADAFGEFLADIERRNTHRAEWESEKNAARAALDELYAAKQPILRAA
ncbi:MAG: hypothetical protein ACR2JX_04680 [Mycobacteriales bacterium]